MAIRRKPGTGPSARAGTTRRGKAPRAITRSVGKRADQLALAQQALGIVTWVWDVSLDRVTWYGDVSLLLGLPPSAFSGRFEDYLARLHPEDRTAARRVFIDCLKGLQPQYRTAERVIWPDGSIHWLEAYGRGHYGMDGRAARLTGVISDITDRKQGEAALAVSRELFSKAFDAAPIALTVFQFEPRRVVEVNEGFERLFGWSAAETIGRDALALGLWIDPADRDAFIRRLADEGRVRGLRSRMRHRDGGERICELAGDVFESEGTTFAVCLANDLTAVLETQHALQQSQRKYRAVFDSSPEAISLFRARDNVFLDVNPAWEVLTRRTRAEAVGQSVAALGLWIDPAMRDPVIERLRHERRLTDIQVPLRLPDGESMDVRGSWTLFELDGEECIAWIGHDNTERRRGEELVFNIARGVSAATGDAFFRSLVAHLARELGADYAFVGALALPENDHVRTLAFVRDGAPAPNFTYRLAGSPCINAIERRGSVSYPSSVAEQFPDDLGLIALGAQGYVGTSLFSASGEALGILVVMSRRPIERVAYWHSMLDIFGTRAAAEIERADAESRVRELNVSLEKRVAERTAALEEANRELESFSYSISHDLRAPLRSIAGFASLLREQAPELPGQSARFLERIELGATRMNELIDDLLQFSSTARHDVLKVQVDMAALVSGVVAELQSGTPSGPATEIGDLPAIQGDASLLRQVWLNLLGNAFKFSRHASAPRVEVGAQREAGGICYWVRDNGAGFDARYADKLFGVFQRLHSESEFEGTGVGLAIVRRIVERHGGTVSAESTSGAGATFRFLLPA